MRKKEKSMPELVKLAKSGDPVAIQEIGKKMVNNADPEKLAEKALMAILKKKDRVLAAMALVYLAKKSDIRMRHGIMLRRFIQKKINSQDILTLLGGVAVK